MLRDRYLETFAERPCIWCTNLDLCITGCMLVYQDLHIKAGDKHILMNAEHTNRMPRYFENTCRMMLNLI